MMRYLLLISAVFWCLVVQAVTPSSYICPISDGMGYTHQSSACMVSVPMQKTTQSKISYKAIENKSFMSSASYNSHCLYSVGASNTPVSVGSSFEGEPLLSERGFPSTSVFRDSEQPFNNVSPDANMSVVRKGPHGGGSSTGEWMPLPDAWLFLVALAAIYGIFKRHQQRAGQSHVSK